MRLKDTTFCLFDTETGGLDPTKHDLLEIGAQLYTDFGNVMGERFTTLVKPTRPIPVESQAIHHLLERDFVDAPTADDALADLLRFVPPDAVWVAHNAVFDFSFLGVVHAPGLGTVSLAPNQYICSKRLANHLSPESPSSSLQVLRYFYGFEDIDQEGLNPHRAIADVLVMAKVFFHEVALYRSWAEEKCAGDAARLAKAEQVETLIAFAKRPYIIANMPFGKHKGEPMESVPLSYWEWALSPTGLTDMDADLKFNIERQMKRNTVPKQESML